MMRVTYSVTYSVDVQTGEGVDLGDSLSDINIPEDGVSEYVPNSFRVLDCTAP